MGIFSRLFGKKANEPAAPNLGGKKPSIENNLSVMVLFAEVPTWDIAALEADLRQRLGASMANFNLFQSEQGGMGGLEMGGDKVMIAQLGFPFPEQVLKPILDVCHFSDEGKQAFFKSKCHVLVSYKGSGVEPVVAMNRMYQVVDALGQSQQVIGVVNESAMTAHPWGMMEMYRKDHQKLEPKAFPIGIWMLWTGGCVKYFIDSQHIWFVTKGNHQFGLPELAFLGGPKDGNSTMEMYLPLFIYMYNFLVPGPGHTADMGAVKLRFSELTEYREVMEGKYGTLVVTKG
ncbi:MAG: hypothetical protein U0176_12400 [Bacteroidia bacterium]